MLDLFNYAISKGGFSTTFQKGDVSVPGIDFVAADLFYILPELKESYDPAEELKIVCNPVNSELNTFTFNETSQNIIHEGDINCAATV